MRTVVAERMQFYTELDNLGWAAIKSVRSDIRLDEVVGTDEGEDDGRTGS
jgi:hypothetical protein